MLFILLDFTPIKPDLGLILWTTLFFLLFWFLIGKMAFKPMASALKKRTSDIQDALDEAKKAKEEMAGMKAENEKLLAQAREERTNILKEANETKNNIVNEAKDQAKVEANRIVNNANAEISNQKQAAMIDVKNQVGTMALQIAEKIIKKNLSSDPEQVTLANTLMDEMNLN